MRLCCSIKLSHAFITRFSLVSHLSLLKMTSLSFLPLLLKVYLELEEKVVDFSALFPGGNPPEVDTFLDLATLQNFKSPSSIEEFVPSSIYVRQEVLTIWKMLRKNEENPQVKSQVLLGSPGVGKSVVLFLHALRRASEGSKVIYFRKTAYEKNTSVFCMDLAVDGNVRVRYNRKVPKVKKINDLYSEVEQQAFPKLYEQNAGTQTTVTQDTLFFVDGPRHDKTEDTIEGAMDYLCTSGGHPYPPSEAMLSKLLVVMSAWDKEEYCRALEEVKQETAMINLQNYFIGESEESRKESMEVDGESDEGMTDDEVFDCVFYYTGGRIRDGVKLVGGSFGIKRYSLANRNRIILSDCSAATLALVSPVSSASRNSIDSVRSMFRNKYGAAFQIVDSQHILSLLKHKITTEKYLNSFKLALQENQKAVAGYHFEAMMHSVFCEATHTVKDPVQESLKATGSGHDGVQQLVRKSMYWMPSTTNFANIDAALVDKDGVVFCVQYTVQADHTFNSTTFPTKFLKRLPQQLGAQKDESARIIYVVPDDVDLQLPDTEPYPNRKLVKIDYRTIETVKKSAARVFEQ